MKLSLWQTLKSRTVWTGIAGAALSAFLAYNPFQTTVTPKAATIGAGALAVLNAIFRANPNQGALPDPAPAAPPKLYYRGDE